MIRIFFSADVHGSTAVWKKWLKVPEKFEANVMMFCGDLTGKSLVPIIKSQDGYTCHYFDKRWALTTEEDVRKMEDRVAAVGVYTIRCTREEVESLQEDPSKVDQVIHEAIKERMRQWLDLLVERVNTQEVKVIVMPGNDDSLAIDDIIRSYEDQGVIYPLDRVVDIGGYEVISLAHIGPSPWDTPRELKEKDLKKKIDGLMKTVKNRDRVIFNFHSPPLKTTLDMAPELSKDLKVLSAAGRASMTHVGSEAIRTAIEEYQPIMGLHGHIHESHGIEKIKDTLIINPGSEYEKGILKGYIIDLTQEGTIEKYWRVEA